MAFLMIVNSKSLTIVIPMYRQLHIEEVLEDLANQTDRNFDLIVASNGPIGELPPKVADLIRDLNATVIEDKEIVGHEDPSISWERAISYAPEGWTWLLGDDDRVGNGCVKAFNELSLVTLNGHNVCRFPVGILEQDGSMTGQELKGSRIIAPRLFLRNRLIGLDLSFASEYVFQKKQLQEIGGFVHFPFAWCSDDATWLQLSFPNGVLQLSGEGAIVHWRNSSTNTSSKMRNSPREFALAERMFIGWAMNDSFLAATLSGIRWKLLFAWWFTHKSLHKKLVPSIFWEQITFVADELKLFRVFFVLFAGLQIGILQFGRLFDKVRLKK